MKDNQIYGNIILGFKNINHKSLSIIKFDPDNSTIIFGSQVDNVVEEHSISVIKDINYSRRLTMNRNTHPGLESALSAHSDYMLMSGNYVQSLAASEAADAVEIDNHYVIGNTYEVNMILVIDGEEKTVKIETEKNPKKFVENIKSKIQ